MREPNGKGFYSKLLHDHFQTKNATVWRSVLIDSIAIYYSYGKCKWRRDGGIRVFWEGALRILSGLFGGIAEALEWASGGCREMSFNVPLAVNNVVNGARPLEGVDLPLPVNEPIPESPNAAPYNCFMDRGDPHCWYVVSIEIQTGIYCTWIEVHNLVTRVLGNKHKKFSRPIDAEQWLQQEYLFNGNVRPDTPHRRNPISKGEDPYGHTLFCYRCYGEIYCNNGYT